MIRRAVRQPSQASEREYGNIEYKAFRERSEEELTLDTIWGIVAIPLWIAGAYLVSRSVFGLAESVNDRIKEMTIGSTILFGAILCVLQAIGIL